MVTHIYRRLVLLIVTPLLLNASTWAYAANDSADLKAAENKINTLEATSGVVIGISAVNTKNNEHIQHREQERFATGSTFKMILAAAYLKNSMQDKNLMQEKIHYGQADLLPWTPITSKHLKDGMSVFDLCAAILMYSDTTAANLLTKKLGGPQAVTAFARSVNDDAFRLDNYEPVNTDPNNPEDSTTPLAMEKTLQKLALGDVLATPQREQFITWMKNNTTGDTRIRAGVPKGWNVADKTGSGNYGVRNDIAIIWPPNCDPIVIAIYTRQKHKDAPPRDDILAETTRIVLDGFAKSDQCIKLPL